MKNKPTGDIVDPTLACLANERLKNMLSDLPRLAPAFAFQNPIPDSWLGDIKTRKAFSEINVNESLAKISAIKAEALMKFDPIFNIGAKFNVISQAIAAESLKIAESLALPKRDFLTFLSEEEFNQFEYNWLLSLPITKIEEFYEQWKDGKLEDINKLFRDGFSEDETINWLLDRFDKNEFFKPRIHIIRDALDAHLSQKYTLSIPVILSQIDGIFIERYEILKDKMFYTCPKCKNQTKILINARNISEYLANHESKYFGWFLNHIVDTFDKLRNKILHGQKLDYPDADLSTKLVLTLYELHHSVQHPVDEELPNNILSE